MKSNRIFDAMGSVDDRYILSAWNRVNEKNRQRNKSGISAFRRLLYSAAALAVMLASFFGVAMAVSADFREAVFRFFHISTADVALPEEEEPERPVPMGSIEVIDGKNIEGKADVTYLRVNGNVDWSDGVIWVASYEEETAGQILGVYGLENGELTGLEPHTEKLEYNWDGEVYEICFQWYENNGRVCTRARDYDLETGKAWEVLAAEGKSDVCTVILGRGAQIDYTSRPLLYNLSTKEVTDVLAGCKALDSQLLNEIKFSADLSRVLLSCNLGRDNYCYDMAEQTLKSLNELTGREVCDAWFVDDDTVVCTFENEDGTFHCRAYTIPSWESVEIFAGMAKMNGNTDFGFILTGGRYGLYVDREHNTYVYDCRTGERTPVEGFQYPSGSTFTSQNKAGDKILFGLSDNDVPGLGVVQIGILDLEKRSFTLLDREGYEVRREGVMGWLDNDRAVIEAYKPADRSDGIRYLYIYSLF